MIQTLPNQTRSMRIMIGILDEHRHGDVVSKLNKVAESQGFRASVDRGLDLFVHSLKLEHPDLVVLVAKEMTEQYKALIRFIRKRETTRRLGIVVLSQLEARTLEEKAREVFETIELGADEVLDEGLTEIELLARIRSVLRQKIMFDELRKANHILKKMTLTDELTGLANMRSFTAELTQNIQQVQNGVHSLAVVMIDIDYFKHINDTSNHLVGSELLAQFAKVLSQFSSEVQGEVAARYGGDEFILMLKTASLEEVMSRVESLRKKVQTQVFYSLDYKFRLTASFGVAQIPPFYKGTCHDAIKAADLELYRSKKHGRNMVSGIQLTYQEYPDNGTKMREILGTKRLSLQI